MGPTAAHTARSSDRVVIAIRIRIFGSDVAGRAYIEETRTLDVSRNGALIIVGDVLKARKEGLKAKSLLYDKDFSHEFRKGIVTMSPSRTSFTKVKSSGDSYTSIDPCPLIKK